VTRPRHVLEGQAGDPFRELPGIGDGRRREDELRLSSVEGSRAPEAADEHGHVGTEDPPVPVGFIDHHHLQVREERCPPVVPGEDLVELVGLERMIRGMLTDPGAAGRRGVPVINGGIGVDPHSFRKVPDRLQLVVGQGLCRVEEKGRRLRVRNEPLQDRRRKARVFPDAVGVVEDSDAFPPGSGPGPCLVRVQADAAPVQEDLHSGGSGAAGSAYVPGLLRGISRISVTPGAGSGGPPPGPGGGQPLAMPSESIR